MASRIPLVTVVVALLCTSMARCQVVVIESDTMFDENNSLPDSVIRVSNGPDGPTMVDIVNGGRVGTTSPQSSEIRGGSSLRLFPGGALGSVNVFDEAEYFHSGTIFPQFDPLSPPLSAIVVARSSSKVFLNDGELWTFFQNSPAVLAQESSQIVFAGGVLVHIGANPGIVAEDNSQIAVTGGEISGGSNTPGFGIHTTDSSHVTISGGWIRSSDAYGLVASDMSTVEIVGGTLSSSDSAGVWLRGAARAVMSEGLVFGEIGMLLSETSHGEIVGGTVRAGMKVTESASVRVSGGDIVGDGLTINGNAHAEITGGLFGGENGAIQVTDEGIVNLRGGRLLTEDDGKELFLSGTAIANVFGFDLHILGSELTGFLADGSPIAWEFESRGAAQLITHELPFPSLPGDYNRNEVVDAADIDILSYGIVHGSGYEPFDLNQSGTVDVSDRTTMVNTLIGTSFGDANLDGEFNSGDLVSVLAAGEYEDDIAMNSGWASGDWNGDGEFTSADLVVALADGGYEMGPRAAVSAVPEPSGIVLVVIAFIGLSADPGTRRQRP